MFIPNPFENVPLNTQRVFVMGTSHTGCEVYLPIKSGGSSYEFVIRKRLQAYLDAQDKPTEIISPDPLEPLLA